MWTPGVAGPCRRFRLDGGAPWRGRIVLTAQGVAALPPEVRAAIVAAVQRFDDFSVGNDPHGEHDCAVLEAAGHQVLFKIDYYDRALCGLSPGPADPAVTRRVLTVLLAGEC